MTQFPVGLFVVGVLVTVYVIATTWSKGVGRGRRGVDSAWAGRKSSVELRVVRWWRRRNRNPDP